MIKVLVSDNLSPKGIELFEATGKIKVDVKTGLSPEELKAIISEYDGLVIRSATKVTEDLLSAAKKLKVVGRAGIGLDNVDIGAATKRGIAVMNTPDGNTITTAEHTISLLLALSRNIPQATASLKAGKWEKKKFQGKEIFGKTLGIIGLGKIGRIVADRATGLKMKVIGFDPYITQEAVKPLGIELVDMDDLLARSDYITVHTPRTSETLGLINKEAFSKMKDGVMVINCARGGIVDEEALYDALTSGKVAGAALDVFSEEPPPPDFPLLKLDNVICTPHLGASTAEAQEKVAVAVANQMIDYLLNGVVRNAVNMPSVPAEILSMIQPYLTLGEKIGEFQSQLISEPVKEVIIEYVGDVAQKECAPITISILKGLLTPIVRDDVNYVNAPILTKERGISVTESKRSEVEDYTNLIQVRTKTESGETTVAGTIFGKSDPRIVRINSFRLDAKPEGHLLLIHNEDRPGVIGFIGTVLGEYDVNIARMYVGQEEHAKKNVILLSTDQVVPQETIEKLKASPYIMSAQALEL